MNSIKQNNGLYDIKNTVSQSGTAGECLLLCFTGMAVFAIVIVFLVMTGCSTDSDMMVDTTSQDIPSTASPLSPSLVLTPTSSPEPTSEQPYTLLASYNREDVSAPCISIYVHALARPYYISVPPETAEKVESALNTGEQLTATESDPSKHSGYAIGIRAYDIGYYATDDSLAYMIIRNADGEFGLSSGQGIIKVTEEAGMLIDLISEATGWDLDTDLSDFRGITTIEVIYNENVIVTVTKQDNLDAFEDFLQNSVHSTSAMNTQEQRVELRCTFSDNTIVSIVADPVNNMLWLPPMSYYTYSSYGWPDEDHILGETMILLDALGLEKWPDEVFEPQPEDFWGRLYERLGAAPPP